MAEAATHGLMEFLLQARRDGRRALGYSGTNDNALMNYSSIEADLLPAVADRAPRKHGKLLPGSHIPVISPVQLDNEAPDALLVLPWDPIEELRPQLPDAALATAISTLKRWRASK